MARIKPQALLLQSKKKKGPSHVSVPTIILYTIAAGVIAFSLVATYKHWKQRPEEQKDVGLRTLEDIDTTQDSKKYDLPGYAILTTSKGDITVELSKDVAPEIVDKFLDLSQKGHFEDMPFQHVIKHHLIQGGGSSEALGAAEDWISKTKLRSQLVTSPKHGAFMLGTSKKKQKQNVFELIITTAPLPDVDDKIITFGRVIRGQDVVKEIEKVDTDENHRPKSPIKIVDVTLKHET